MSISKEAIAQIAHLARLPSETESGHSSIQQDLNNIVQMIDQIKAIDTKEISAMAHPLDMPQPMRMDTITEQNERDNLIKLAPQAEAGFYLVPLVLEEEI